jgi:hypothetical protein
MSAPLILGPLNELGHRPFSFYPPIVNIEHNEWTVRRATWTDVQVRNTKTGAEIWVPRRFVGEISSTDEPFVIVGLVKELEYAAGAVLPHVRRVIEMPRAVNGWPRVSAPEPTGPAPVVAIRVESGTGSRARRVARGAVALGILVCFVAGIALRDNPMRSRGGRNAVREVVALIKQLSRAF